MILERLKARALGSWTVQPGGHIAVCRTDIGGDFRVGHLSVSLAVAQ